MLSESAPEVARVPFATRAFDILVERNEGGSIGLDISTHDGETLLIGRVWEDGPVHRWNEMCGPDSPKVVRGTDRIFEVNGVGGDAVRILDAIKATTTLSIKVRRRLAVDWQALHERACNRRPPAEDVRRPESSAADVSADAEAVVADHTRRSNIVIAEEAPETWQQPLRSKTREFDIRIEKDHEGQGMGLDISTQDGRTLLIGRVREGPVGRWNDNLGDRDCFEYVRNGDRIVQVNGSRSCDGMLAAVKTADVLSIQISRMVEFEVTVFRADRIGLQVDHAETDMLIVRGLTDGPIKEMNKTLSIDFEIRPGDQIAEVNGISGPAKDLMNAIHSASTLRLLIKRPTPD